jgi:prolyl-tRNA editing enzyme YbaK/EbsC (Cys-tRNA(Pro) deacylase)
VDEARAFGIEVGEVLKTLAVRAGAGYALTVIPVHAQVCVDPEVLSHDTVTFAAGTQTESVKMQTQELFGTAGR